MLSADTKLLVRSGLPPPAVSPRRPQQVLTIACGMARLGLRPPAPLLAALLERLGLALPGLTVAELQQLAWASERLDHKQPDQQHHHHHHHHGAQHRQRPRQQQQQQGEGEGEPQLGEAFAWSVRARLAALEAAAAGRDAGSPQRRRQPRARPALTLGDDDAGADGAGDVGAEVMAARGPMGRPPRPAGSGVLADQDGVSGMERAGCHALPAAGDGHGDLHPMEGGPRVRTGPSRVQRMLTIAARPRLRSQVPQRTGRRVALAAPPAAMAAEHASA